MTLDVQFLTMLSMALGGIYLGFALDTFRRLTGPWTQNKLLAFMLEVGFWAVQTVLLFYILFRVNGGELRFYVFLACLLGFSIYQIGFATLYKKVLESIISIVQTIIRWVQIIVRRLIIQPILILLKVCNMILLALLQGLATVCLILIKIIYLPLKWIVQLIYRLLPKRIKEIIYQFVQFYSTMIDKVKKFVQSIRFNRR
ncbi:spore cortex biosynthesis protein YabQ [Virgibacillus sp. W0181]|uniref:spore cortex biosynthesis protein YabQ n=1 Tax=Virgibacillus sp. W0181 TaxID=3391581 RepID=UPI003F46F77D